MPWSGVPVDVRDLLFQNTSVMGWACFFIGSARDVSLEMAGTMVIL
jgi:hypothetical protein